MPLSAPLFVDHPEGKAHLVMIVRSLARLFVSSVDFTSPQLVRSPVMFINIITKQLIRNYTEDMKYYGRSVVENPSKQNQSKYLLMCKTFCSQSVVFSCVVS